MKNDFFEVSKKQLNDKNVYLQNYIDYMFTKTNEIFIYKNLPKNIDVKKLEYFLQKNGYIFFTKIGNDFNFLNGCIYDYDIYNEPQKINCVMYDRTVKTFDCNKDGVLIGNDFLYKGIEDIFKKYGVMLCECEISLYINAITNRIPFLISANDDNTKKSADLFIEKIYKGDFSIIGSNAFFDGIETNTFNNNSDNTQKNIELTQYIKASAFNEIGLNSNFNLKRERLNNSEIAVNENAIKPYIYNMLDCRKKAVEKINAMYGLNVEVELSTVWDNYDNMETTDETTDETIKNNMEV